MKVKIKKSYYFEKDDRKAFKVFLIENDMNQEIFAKKCGISLGLLSSILFGKRAITEKNIEKFESLGLKLNKGE